MRTKALLCAASMVAAGAATSMAQNVYSLNVVGYVSVTVTNHHYALVNNPFVLSGSANNVSNLLDAAMPPGGTAYGFTPGTTFFTMTRSLFGHTWSGGGTQLLPNGTGFFINNSAATNATFTFVGDVPQGALTNKPVATGNKYNLLGMQVPQSGYLKDLGLVYLSGSGGGDSALRFNTSTTNFVTYTKSLFTPFNWSGGPGGLEPVDAVKGPFVNVGEGFFYKNSSGQADFERNFTVQ